jgi:spore germination protein
VILVLRIILTALIVVVVVGTGYWGYQEHQEKNAVLIQAENNYQQAFHDLTYHIDELQDKIGATLAMNSGDSLSSSLANVWRITSLARSEVGQLPLTLMPFNNTEEFLSNVGEFSYRTSVRNLDDKPLSDKEYDTLKSLYKQSSEIKKQLRSVQAIAMKNQLRWMDVELALASDEEPQDNTIIDGFKTVDKEVESSDINWGPEVNKLSKKDEGKFDKLPGDKISKQQAKKKAREFLGFNENVDVNVKETGKGANFKAFSLEMEHPENGAKITMDMTQKGGHPLWMMQDRKIGKPEISLNKASKNAEDFLQKHAFDKMEMSVSNQYDNIGVFSFVSVEDGVRIYPDSVRIKVSLDKGDVVAYDAMDYLANHNDRTIGEPKLKRKEALDKVNGNVKVMEDRIALIENDFGDEVLCYEILGTMDTDTYRIFINANTGAEEKVKKMDKSKSVNGSL